MRRGDWTRITAVALSMAAMAFAPAGAAQNSTVPGKLSSPYPTVTNLAVEWEIQGDDNLNAVCKIEYKREGEAAWQAGMPLVRVPAGDTEDRTSPQYRWMNKFSGSIFDLRPGTRYEIKLSLRDPDGGKADTVLTVSTRPVPAPAADGKVIQADPRTFEHLAACAQPGDILVLTPGYYGEWRALCDGAPDRPIVVRADNAHPLIGSTFESVDLQYRQHVIVEGLTVQGNVNIRFCRDVTVRRCKVFSRSGISANQQPGCTNCYISDNEVSWLTPWAPESMGSGSIWGGAANQGEGIEITGPGNVICFNRVHGYRDCISLMEDLWVYDQICDDIYNNDISVGPDDAIEADFSFSNCRIMRNRITNCGMGLSAQPSLGGPNYFIRNVMYNTGMAPYKLERKSYGSLFLHNTSVQAGDGLKEHHQQGEYFRMVWLNNLALGGPGGGKHGRYSSGDGQAVALPGFNSTCTFDYNAVGADGLPFGGVLGLKRFSSLAELNKLSGGHSVEVGDGVFAPGAQFPNPPFPEREPQDLRLAPGSAAVDAGVVIPGVNDGFRGKAPDIGAYELGQELPHYGPRSAGVDELTEWERLHGK